MSARRNILHSTSCVLFGTFLSGCVLLDSTATGGNSASDTKYTYLEERIQTLTARITDLEQRNANLQNDVRELQTRLSQVQNSTGGQASATEMQQLRSQIQSLEAQREKDKQIILDQVAKEIAGMAGSRRTAPTRAPSGGSDVGYEHVVKQGQTLTDIAKAYGVTVAAIKKENSLSSDSIRVGQKLFIPKTQ